MDNLIFHLHLIFPGKFRALGNIGDVLLKQTNTDEAIKMYQRQLALARSAQERGMESQACGSLGLAHRLLRRFDKALGFHTQELTLRQEIGDVSGECKAHGSLGAVHMALGKLNFINHNFMSDYIFLFIVIATQGTVLLMYNNNIFFYY